MKSAKDMTEEEFNDYIKKHSKGNYFLCEDSYENINNKYNMIKNIIIGVLTALLIGATLYGYSENKAGKVMLENGIGWVQSYSELSANYDELESKHNGCVSVYNVLTKDVKYYKTKAAAFDSYSNLAQQYGQITISYENGQLVTYR